MVNDAGQTGGLTKNEIEVTQEMLNLGYKVLQDSGIADYYPEADKLTLAEIFRAMAIAHPVASALRRMR